MPNTELIEHCKKVLTPQAQVRVDKAIALAEEYVAKRYTLWRQFKELFNEFLSPLPEQQGYIRGLLDELNFALKEHWVGCGTVERPLRPIEAFFEGVLYARSIERSFYECTCHLERGIPHEEFRADMREFLENARAKAQIRAATEQQKK